VPLCDFNEIEFLIYIYIYKINFLLVCFFPFCVCSHMLFMHVQRFFFSLSGVESGFPKEIIVSMTMYNLSTYQSKRSYPLTKEVHIVILLK
jgi:hypothetical protein